MLRTTKTANRSLIRGDILRTWLVVRLGGLLE